MFGGYSNRRGIQVFDLKSETWTEMVKKNISTIHEKRMECYATPWSLWRESRILWHIVELSLAFGGLPLSLSPSLFCLSFLSLVVLMPVCWPKGLPEGQQ